MLQVAHVQLSTLIAALLYNGSDAALAAADSLLPLAGTALLRDVMQRLEAGQDVGAMHVPEVVQGKKHDRYIMERIILQSDRASRGFQMFEIQGFMFPVLFSPTAMNHWRSRCRMLASARRWRAPFRRRQERAFPNWQCS